MSTMSLASIDELIERRPDFWGGRPHVAGTGVSVARVGVLWGEGLTAEEIADAMSLSLVQSFAALTFYLQNRTAIDSDMAAEDAETDRLATDYYREHGHLR